MAYGKHIELFLVDGEAGGITTADVASWTGHILSGPRSRLSDLLAREEAHRNGVYLLLGDDPESIDNTRCYIGKTEDFSRRFLDHDKRKDWWDRAILISSLDDSFNEGHWGYVESRLVEIAKQAERSSLDDNKQTPQLRKLSEAQQSDAEAFIEQVRVVLPVLGVSVFKTRPSKPQRRVDEQSGLQAEDFSAPPSSGDTLGGDSAVSPLFTFAIPKRRILARAQVVAGEFLLLEGSIVSGRVTGRAKSSTTERSYTALKARFDKLVADGSIHIDGETATITRDLAFPSPSAAGAIVAGRSCNGRISWVTVEGLSYGDWEERGTTSDEEAGE